VPVVVKQTRDWEEWDLNQGAFVIGNTVMWKLWLHCS